MVGNVGTIRHRKIFVERIAQDLVVGITVTFERLAKGNLNVEGNAKKVRARIGLAVGLIESADDRVKVKLGRGGDGGREITFEADGTIEITFRGDGIASRSSSVEIMTPRKRFVDKVWRIIVIYGGGGGGGGGGIVVSATTTNTTKEALTHYGDRGGVVKMREQIYDVKSLTANETHQEGIRIYERITRHVEKGLRHLGFQKCTDERTKVFARLNVSDGVASRGILKT